MKTWHRLLPIFSSPVFFDKTVYLISQNTHSMGYIYPNIQKHIEIFSGNVYTF